MAKATFTAQDVPNTMQAAINAAHAANWQKYVQQQQQQQKRSK